MTKKTKIDFEELNVTSDIDLIEKIFPLEDETIETKENKTKNNFLSSIDMANNSLKKNKKKEYEYKKIFNGSLEEHKSLKRTANIYNHNMERISILCDLNKGLLITDAINYIINDFFVRNNQELREEHKSFYLELNKKFI